MKDEIKDFIKNRMRALYLDTNATCKYIRSESTCDNIIRITNINDYDFYKKLIYKLFYSRFPLEQLVIVDNDSIYDFSNPIYKVGATL